LGQMSRLIDIVALRLVFEIKITLTVVFMTYAVEIKIFNHWKIESFGLTLVKVNCVVFDGFESWIELRTQKHSCGRIVGKITTC
jgi:hypothetical protein